MKNDGFTLRKRLRSFRYAFNGIRLLIRHEHNAWIHCLAAVCAVTAGWLTGLSAAEWIAIAFAIGLCALLVLIIAIVTMENIRFTE